jgi:hypothetical protein
VPGSEVPKPIHPALIRVFQMANTTDLKDVVNGSTLQELKFKHNENLSAFKKTVFKHRRAPILVDNPVTLQPELTMEGNRVCDAIFEDFSIVNEDGTKVLTKQNIIEFTK